MSSGAKGFNFYEQWLGIECDSRPDHYQLLGITPFETDEQKIQAAFEVRRQRLQRIDPGEFAEQLRKLADEVIAAKRCLLTPAARLAYDERLRYRQSQQRSQRDENGGLTLANSTPTGAAARPTNERTMASLPARDDELGDLELPPVAGVTSTFVPQDRPTPAPTVQSPIYSPIGVPIASTGRRSVRSKPRRRSQQGFVVVLGVLGVVAVFGLLVLSNMPAEPVAQDQSKTVAKSSTATGDPPKSLAAAATSDLRIQTKQPIAEPPPIRPEDWNIEFNSTLNQVRRSLAQRNIDRAKELIAACEKLAKWDEQRELLRLHQQLVRYTSDFWRAVGDGAAKMNGGEELEQGGKLFANVVESSSMRLVVKVDGRNHRYTIPGDIDAAVAVAIAKRILSDPMEQAKAIGAFYAIDAAGDFAKAEQVCNSIGDEMKPLLTLLKAERDRAKRK